MALEVTRWEYLQEDSLTQFKGMIRWDKRRVRFASQFGGTLAQDGEKDRG